MKEQQDHDVSASRFHNSKDRYYHSTEILSENRHDYYSLFMQLQILISIFRNRVCQDMLSCQQENISL